MKVLFHIFLSLSLLYIGEYLTTILLQLVFLSIFYKWNYIAYIMYIPVSTLGLFELFSSASYFLYFVNLVIFYYYIYWYGLILKPLGIIFVYLYIGGLALISWNIENIIYEIQLYINIIDCINQISVEVVFILSLLHLLIFFILGYNREKLFRK